MTRTECINEGFMSCGKLSDGTELLKNDVIIQNHSCYQYVIIDKNGFTKEPIPEIISKEIIELLFK